MNALLWLVAASLVLAILFQAMPALSQTEFLVACENGVCHIREADLLRLQSVINALVERITELQGKCGGI